jgi:hypothetical protein
MEPTTKRLLQVKYYTIFEMQDCWGMMQDRSLMVVVHAAVKVRSLFIHSFFSSYT